MSVFKGTEGEKLKTREIEDSFKEFFNKEKNGNEAVPGGENVIKI